MSLKLTAEEAKRIREDTAKRAEEMTARSALTGSRNTWRKIDKRAAQSERDRMRKVLLEKLKAEQEQMDLARIAERNAAVAQQISETTRGNDAWD